MTTQQRMSFVVKSSRRAGGVAAGGADGSRRDERAACLTNGWMRLSEIAEISSGGTPSKAVAAYWGGDIPWITARDMRGLLIGDSSSRITQDAVAAGAKLMPANTIFVVVRGMILLSDIPVAVSLR